MKTKNHFKFLGDTIEGPVKIIRYPDGQRSVCLNLEELDKKSTVSISARVKHFSDLELLSCLINALKRNDFYIENLSFWYLFGVRSDRAFSEGEPNYFKEVVAPIINSWGIDKIWLAWPFEPLAATNKYIKNMSIFGELSSMHVEQKIYIDSQNSSKYVIGGDQTSRVFFNRRVDGYFLKKRNVNGDITISLEGNISKNNAIIVDDLCDGGATFIKAAQWLEENNMRPEVLELFVYHGLFTKGIDVVAKHFDRIYCTNSYQDIDHPKVTQYRSIV